MSIGPMMGVLAGAAGAPLAQTKGPDAERAIQETSVQQRGTERAEQAEAAAGIAQTDGEEHETEDRDADGRRLWEETAEKMTKPDDPHASAAAPEHHTVRDPSGQRGSNLDLSG